MKNFRTIQIATVFLLVSEIQGFDLDYVKSFEGSCISSFCKWTEYCNNSSKTCEDCSYRFNDCFTAAHESGCTYFCMHYRHCPPLKLDLQHGGYRGLDGQENKYSKTLHFFCDEGFHNTGVNKTICKFGSWSHNEPDVPKPFCEKNFCKSPPIPKNGGIIPPGLEHFDIGKWITVTCNDGFSLKGDAGRQCLLNGSWSFSSATCEAKEPLIHVWIKTDITISAVCLLCLMLMFYPLYMIWSELQTKMKEKDPPEQQNTDEETNEDTLIPFDDRANRYVHLHPQEPNGVVIGSSRDDDSLRNNSRTERNNPVRQEFGNNNGRMERF